MRSHCGAIGASKYVLVALSGCTVVSHCQPIGDRIEVSSLQPAAPGILIVKYGGSAITNKQSFECLNKSSLDGAAQQLKAVHSRRYWSKIVLVHGAGSYGHFHAKHYGLKSGGSTALQSNNQKSPEAWQTGLALTRQSVLKLNKQVVDAHIALDMPAATISTFPSTITGYSPNITTCPDSSAIITHLYPPVNPNGSRIIDAGALKMVSDVSDAGLIPVLHGDVVLDRDQRCAILGGDHIIYWLCRNLDSPSKPEERQRIRVVFLTDVTGVYDRAPRLPGATLIRRIDVLPDGKTNIMADMETAAHDVTGGIEAKLQAAISMAQLGKHVEVFIVQVGSRSALQAMSGEYPEEGTFISLK